MKWADVRYCFISSKLILSTVIDWILHEGTRKAAEKDGMTLADYISLAKVMARMTSADYISLAKAMASMRCYGSVPYEKVFGEDEARAREVEP